MRFKLDARLAAVADCVRDGAFLADIGTDHAYLPIYLMQKDKIRGAVASDIHEGPLVRAQANIREAGLSEKIETLLTNGLAGIERYPVTDIVIAGMGGQLIAEILDAAPFVRERRVRLILQPMQNVEQLREYLSHGYAVEFEKQAVCADKLYQILCVRYDGEMRRLTLPERELGAYNIMHKGENPVLFAELCRRKLALLDDRIRGLRLGGYDVEKEEMLRRDIASQLEEIKTSAASGGNSEE